MKEKEMKKQNAFLAGFLAFAMTASWFYAPNSLRSHDNVAEALSIGNIWNHNYTGGQQTFTVPETGVYQLETWGAQGGNAGWNGTIYTYGGYGGYSKGAKTLTKGQVLYIQVGGQGAGNDAGSNNYLAGGYNGGGYGYNGNSSANRGAGGGGATDIRLGGTALGNRIIVAGGGGGGTYFTSYGTNYPGTGGGTSGGDGFTATFDSSQPHNGKGGTQSAGGAGGINGGTGLAGSLGNGGNVSSAYGYGESGGGGGYYGGGSSGTGMASGGGSGYIGGVTSGTMSNGIRAGHGQVIITQMLPTISTQSPANSTKFQNNYIDVSWTGETMPSGSSITRYDIQAGTTSGGTNILALTNKGTATTQRLTVPAGTAGNTTIYWRVRAYDHGGNAGPWKEQTVIYSNNVPTITATPNTPVKLDVSLEKRNHGFSINSLKDPDDFNYVTLYADVLEASGSVVPGSKKQIVLDSSLVNSARLISGTSSEKDGSLQGPFDHKTPFNLKLSLQPNFTNGTFDITLTKADGTTNVIKSGQKLLTGRTMQASSATAAENYTLRIYPEDRQNTNALSASPLAGINDVVPIKIPFTSDTRNYLPRLTSVKHDVAKRVFSDAQGFNRISVTGHIDDSDPSDKVTVYYELQPKASNYAIQVKTVSGKVVPKSGIATQSFNPKVDADFAFTYQIDSNLDSGNYALLVYGYDSQEGIGDYVEIPFTVDRGAPTIDFVADYSVSGKTIKMSSAQKQIVAEDNKIKLYFTPNNYATFEYAGYLIRGGAVKDMRIRGAFTNDVKASFIGVDLGKDPITLLDGATTDFKLGDVIVFKFKATSATGIITQKEVRILIGNDASNFTPLDDAKLPVIN